MNVVDFAKSISPVRVIDHNDVFVHRSGDMPENRWAVHITHPTGTWSVIVSNENDVKAVTVWCGENKLAFGVEHLNAAC